MNLNKFRFLSILFMTVLLGLGCGYQTGDGHQYSIWQVLLYPETLAGGTQISMNTLLVASQGGSMFRVFSILCTGLGFVMGFYQERSSGNIRYRTYYLNTRGYSWRKILNCLSSGGVICLISYLLMSGVLLLGASLNQCILIIWGELPMQLLSGSAGMFLYGIMQNAWILFGAGWIRDRYLMLCFPFFVEYLYQQVLFRFSSFYADHMMLDQLYQIQNFYPHMLIQIFSGTSVLQIGSLWSCFVILSILSFLVELRCRLDKGC